MNEFDRNPVLRMLHQCSPKQFTLFDTISEKIANLCKIDESLVVAYVLTTFADFLEKEKIGINDTLKMPELWCYLALKKCFSKLSERLCFSALEDKTAQDQLIEIYYNWKKDNMELFNITRWDINFNSCNDEVESEYNNKYIY